VEQRDYRRLVSSVRIEVAHGVDQRSPGHQVDGGALSEILVGRSATRWLRASERPTTGK
jgi:hypothetical protein